MTKRKILLLLLIMVTTLNVTAFTHVIKTEADIVTEPEHDVQTVTELPVTELPVAEPKPISLGEYKLTAYCSCSKCCGVWAENRPLDEYGNEIVIGATGEVLTSGYSIAVDPTIIAYGTEVIINGQTYKAMDCGGSIKGNRIDVYFNNHSEALAFGVQYAEVKIFN